jgi:hypothetical protein
MLAGLLRRNSASQRRGEVFRCPLPVIASEAKQSSATLEDSLFHPSGSAEGRC